MVVSVSFCQNLPPHGHDRYFLRFWVICGYYLDSLCSKGIAFSDLSLIVAYVVYTCMNLKREIFYIMDGYISFILKLIIATTIETLRVHYIES